MDSEAAVPNKLKLFEMHIESFLKDYYSLREKSIVGDFFNRPDFKMFYYLSIYLSIYLLIYNIIQYESMNK